MAKNSSVMRPCLLGTDGLHHATITGLTMLNPPGWFNLISNSTNVLVSDMTMLVGSQLTGAPAKVFSALSTLKYKSTDIEEHGWLGYLSELEHCYSELKDSQH